MLKRGFSKARVQIEDVISHKGKFKASAKIVLGIVNRRRIPLPSAIYDYFNRVGEISDEFGDENFLMKYITPKPGFCLVDVGANIGMWAFFVGKKGVEVYAFEPMPKAYNVLRERAKKFPTVHPYPYALGEGDSVGRLGFAALSLTGTMDEEINLPGGGTIDVPVRKLDSIPLPKVGVIKIDTEGYETPILRGAKETISKNRPRLIIEVHQGTGKAAKTFSEEEQRIKKILSDFDYTWTEHCRPLVSREMQPHLIADPKPKIIM
jgi:FkbM family methyltransferase